MTSPQPHDTPVLTYTLDDTLVGRIAPAVATAVSVALPEYVPCRLTRGLLNAAMFTGAFGVSVWATTQDDNPDNDPEVALANIRAKLDAADDTPVDSPRGFWTKAALVGAGTWAAVKAQSALIDASSKALSAAGVSKPRTLIGLGLGAAVYALGEATQRAELAAKKEK
ncbi:hypothetical protein CCICO_00455 [Corynebacterium ciconiae DSM 44920]|uniref:hypothetical protein n=1 Tax=Corynebacterium ciconiae TaxID=227319 RepID=UPI0003782B84|nr:hypothetical protein [Corynebacterium ciconiae]WKD60154.1 hypothetical protein CCICO_00455 [Corynebacterium ciconiae DSM 44920]